MSHWMNHTRHILGSTILGAAAALACLFAAPSSAKGDLDIPREFAINASQVETGFLYNSHDSYKFGDFIGVDDERIYWVGNMDFRGRRAFDSDSPIFWRLRASNLGLDSRSIDIEYGQQGRFAFNLDYDEIPKYQIDDAHTVDDVMTRNPETVRTSDSVLKAVKIFRERRYGALPVLNKDGELVGILSAQDLLGALEEYLVKG